jgi:ketopantoate hydroxymethyltransferase
VHSIIGSAVQRYHNDVVAGLFPSPEEGYK